MASMSNKLSSIERRRVRCLSDSVVNSSSNPVGIKERVQKARGLPMKSCDSTWVILIVSELFNGRKPMEERFLISSSAFFVRLHLRLIFSVCNFNLITIQS